MKDVVRITAPQGPLQGTVNLPASKSVSNRVLIIRALSGADFSIENQSDADDTRLLDACIRNRQVDEYCGEGGTTFRFLLALRACQGMRGNLTAQGPMLDRPVAPLVNALNDLGAGIEYLKGEGRASVVLSGNIMHGGEVTVQAGISSQFLSALMLIGPCLEGGLRILTIGKVVSGPYITMTAALMREFGCRVEVQDDSISVEQGVYHPKSFLVPPDWSAASVFYALVAARTGSRFHFPALGTDCYQGDRELSRLMQRWGVQTQVDGGDVLIHSGSNPAGPLEVNFEDNPDLAQAFAVLAAVMNRPCILRGLSTLRIKETDRIAALVIELSKAGANVHVEVDRIQIGSGITARRITHMRFDAHGDHRMVMALSLLCLTGEPVIIRGAHSISKSFPCFFEQLSQLGFTVYYPD